MKKEQVLTPAQKKEQKMISLIKKAMDIMDIDEILQLAYDNSNGNQQDYLKDKMISILSSEGAIIVAGKMGIDKKGKLIEFIEREIYTSYNEQKNSIFSY
jgi:hypothetical protein